MPKLTMTAAQKRRMKAACDDLNALRDELRAKVGEDRLLFLYLDGSQNLCVMNERRGEPRSPREQDIVHSVKLNADGGDW